MLRGQYGTATPSSLAPVVHREDAQPNEGIQKRFHKLPPPIRSTAAPSRATSIHYRGSRGRGSYSSGNMSQRGQGQHSPYLQYAIRGNTAWRGRGKSSSRGSYPNWTSGHATMSSNNDISSPSASSSSGTTPSVGVGVSLPREEMDPGPSYRRTHHTAFPNASQTSATPPIVASARETWWMTRSRSPTPILPAAPLKRRKIEEQPVIPPPTTISRLPLPGRTRKAAEPVKQEPVVKQEPLSPSPPPRPISPERRLITEACQFYPFPNSCKGSDPNHRQNRRSFFLEKNKELVRLGLKKTKAFSRDDGLVIEWSSTAPVWSDTLQPEVVNLATVIQRASEINSNLTQSSSPVKRKKRLARHSSDSVPSPSRAQVKDLTPPASTGVKTPSHASTAVKTPPRTIPPIPRKRLPLPGRQCVEPKPVTVPVAFAPRGSATPSSVSSCTPRFLGITKNIDSANRPTRESTPTAAVPNRPKTLPTLYQSEDTYSQELAGDHRTQEPYSVDGMPDHRHDRQYAATAAPSPTSNSNMAAPDAKITHMTRDDEHHSPFHNDCVEAEDVAISLLSQSRDNLSSDDDPEIDISTDDDGANEIEGLVADFLQRYCQLFDSDRSKLAAAYDNNALFSCCVHHLEQPSFSMAGLFAPEVNSSFRSSRSRASASTINRGRTQINDRLLSMGPYQFCPRGVTGNLLYDAVDSPAGILLTVHGEIVNPHTSNPHMDHVLTLDQSFVLRQRGINVQEEEEDAINGPRHFRELAWPLVAISHQMTVRAAPLLSTERLEESSPWIRDIIRT